MRASDEWRLIEDGSEHVVTPRSTVQASDGEALGYLAITGVSMTRLSRFTVRAELRAGRRTEVLPGRMVVEMEAFHAVYVGQDGLMPAPVRVMLDYLAQFGRVDRMADAPQFKSALLIYSSSE